MKDRGELIEDAAYEGFSFGIDVVLQTLELEALPTRVWEVLGGVRDGRRHMPRRDALETVVQRKGYDQFTYCIASRALRDIEDGQT